jgi:hypothetical protein
LGLALGTVAGAGAEGRNDGLRRLLLIAGTQSHPPGQHEYNAGVLLLQKCLEGVSGLETRVALSGWPEDASLFEGIDALYLFMDGGARHNALKGDRPARLGAMMERGVGLGCCHFALEVPAGANAKRFQSWVGATYENRYSCNPIWTAEFDGLPDHAIARGVRPFHIEDEWYFNLRFGEGGPAVTPLLTAVPSDKVRHGPYSSPRGPYPHIVRASGRRETLMWAVERPDGGRGFGFTGGHFHHNWANDDFRKIVLNALVWLAKLAVPAGGVQSTVTREDMRRGLF